MLNTLLPIFPFCLVARDMALVITVCSGLLHVELDLNILCRRKFLSGEIEDCKDCHRSGATIAADCMKCVSNSLENVSRAVRTGRALIADCRTIAGEGRHQAAVCFE